MRPFLARDVQESTQESMIMLSPGEQLHVDREPGL